MGIIQRGEACDWSLHYSTLFEQKQNIFAIVWRILDQNSTGMSLTGCLFFLRSGKTIFKAC